MEEGLIRNYLDNVVAHLDTEGRDDVDILVTKYINGLTSDKKEDNYIFRNMKN